MAVVTVCDYCGGMVENKPHVELRVLVGHVNAPVSDEDKPSANYKQPRIKHLCYTCLRNTCLGVSIEAIDK